MTESQILAIALASAPTMITVLIGILINNARLGDMNGRLGDVNAHLGDLRHHIDSRFDEVDRRFDDMRDMWRSELHRVEEVLDARLRHLEER
jgi:hypothetical protein